MTEPSTWDEFDSCYLELINEFQASVYNMHWEPASEKNDFRGKDNTPPFVNVFVKELHNYRSFILRKRLVQLDTARKYLGAESPEYIKILTTERTALNGLKNVIQELTKLYNTLFVNSYDKDSAIRAMEDMRGALIKFDGENRR